MGILSRFITWLIVFIFAAAGTNKLTDKIKPDLYQFKVLEYQEFAKVHPCKVLFDYTVDADIYRVVVASVELTCALLLLVVPVNIKVLIHLLLMFIVTGVNYNLYMLGEPPARFIPAASTFVLLSVNIFLMNRREDTPNKETKVE